MENYIDEITRMLGVEPERKNDGVWLWKIVDTDTKQMVFLTLFLGVQSANGEKSNIVSIQNTNGYFELHDFKLLVPIEPNEIAFVSYDASKVSCMVVSKNCACSLYSNIDRSILNTNIAELDNALLLSAMQLALIEETLP
jgi:hypothetical protein